MKTLAFTLIVVLAGVPRAAPAHPTGDQPPPLPPAARSSPLPSEQLPAAASDYVIGPEDVLSVVFWRDKDMSADVAVRSDGKISLPLLNEIQAAGLTPMQLRDQLTLEAMRYVEDPTVSVVVRQINSRKVFVTGQVAKPGPYALTAATTVLQILAIAGGLREYADEKGITVVRTENGRTVAYPFNYKDVSKRKNLRQNIELKPGDTVVVP